MANLPSVYTSNIEIFESRVKAADSENLAQRQGKNLNYLYDQLPVLSSSMASMSLTSFRIKQITIPITIGGGNSVTTIYTTAAGQKIFFAQGVKTTTPYTSLSWTGGTGAYTGGFVGGGIWVPTMAASGTGTTLEIYNPAVYGGTGGTTSINLTIFETAV